MEFSEKLKELRSEKGISQASKARSRHTYLTLCRCKMGERLGITE